MNEARPYASLSSGLLARKGAAKPAMRPQGFGHFGPPAGLDDLGWNDMGQLAPEPDEREFPEHVPSSITALTPSPRPAHADSPHVAEQQRVIAESFGAAAEAPAEPEPEAKPVRRAEVVALRKPQAAAKGKKAAFTLRLDPDRHYRLRLACAVTGRSAQQIVAGALDQWLETLPEVEALADRVPVNGSGRN